MPESRRKKLPLHPVPTVRIGRLAVDRSVRGERLGETLLFHSLRGIRDVAQRIGVHAVEVDAKDEKMLVASYRRYEMSHLFDDDPLHLFLPMETISSLLLMNP